MRFKNEELQDVKLVMYEKTMLPESEMKEVDGKKQFVKTGKETEFTTYTFRDGYGEKMVALSKDNSFRDLEGSLVNITVDVTFNDFTKKNQVKLLSCEAKTAKTPKA